MSRPRKTRTIEGPPYCKSFKPQGIPTRYINTIVITVEEYECVRLADYNNLEHKDASAKLGISRSVFTRMLQNARNKIAKAIIDGCELLIEGGEFDFENNRIRCLACHNTYQAPINEVSITVCPNCSSDNLQNLNGQYSQRVVHGGRRHRGGRC
ncbi:MAG: DUF134 domain-containing protein [Spirochaetes bacterium]|nr:DUF134 domain-containing protein [Spirochaetota bacterium]MBN2770152.1 DUF134 domain-containing protein [Spirochaetota bacterium]